MVVVERGHLAKCHQFFAISTTHRHRKPQADFGGEAERFGNKNPPSDVLVELRGMFIAEKEQRRYDRFWGLDKEQADQVNRWWLG